MRMLSVRFVSLVLVWLPFATHLVAQAPAPAIAWSFSNESAGTAPMSTAHAESTPANTEVLPCADSIGIASLQKAAEMDSLLKLKTSLLERDDINLILRDIRLERDYVLATNTSLGGASPPGLSKGETLDIALECLKKDPYFLPSSMKVLEATYSLSALAVLLDPKLRRGTPRIVTLKTKLSDHMFALSQMYEILFRQSLLSPK